MGNILILINSSGLGGAETVVLEILKKTKNSCFCLKKDKIDRFSKFSKKIYFGTKKNWYKLNPFILLKLIKCIKKNKITTIHVHLANSLIYALILKKLIPSIKIIYHEHGEIFYNFRLRLLLALFNKEINLIIAVSKTTKKELLKKSKLPSRKIKVLYNFVNLSKFNPKKIKKIRKKLNLSTNKLRIGFSGRLTKIKGCEYLIRALSKLNFNYTCLIAGDGELKKDLKKLAKSKKIQDKILFLGYQKNMIKFYSSIDILVIPSLSESFGMSLIEAQASGVPIIASNIPAFEELTKPLKSGILFKTRDSNDLGLKINSYYYNKKLHSRLIAQG
ncbi:MAG: glycosyltransferase family 4 protein, partial [Candidatus Nanoarchaeia archaeon]|nr:glycosyltransferase family 4 protein [Candidatus Nanoarchaeia archaeon]